MDAELNRGIAQALAEQGYRVALLDLLGHGRSDKPTHASTYRIDSYADQVIALLDHLGAERAVLGGISLGANVSLFAAAHYPERVEALVLEMPVLERAVPAAAMVFVPMVLAAHYGRGILNITSGLMSRVPRTRIGPLNSALNALSLPPGVDVRRAPWRFGGSSGPHPGTAPHHRRPDARAGPPQRSHPPIRRCSRPGCAHAECSAGPGPVPVGAAAPTQAAHQGNRGVPLRRRTRAGTPQIRPFRLRRMARTTCSRSLCPLRWPGSGRHTVTPKS